jgi:hypothetical protein
MRTGSLRTGFAAALNGGKRPIALPPRPFVWSPSSSRLDFPFAFAANIRFVGLDAAAQ